MKNTVAPSKKFKEKASLAIAAVTFYFIIYILLLSGSLAITGYAIYGGISLIINFPRIFTILLGIGIILFAVLILVFLIKFLFVRNKIDLSGFIALKEEEEPEFFKLVYDLAEEVGTKKPKKIYLSPEVNAAVFYEHPILSMLFPVSKNLVVGVGLINSMKENELRAILAHEFGHFSQRSMKIGSYAASANKMIHNMLFENDSYQNMASSINGGHIIVNLLVMLALVFVQGIQWIQFQLYILVNKSNLALSREMEYHADAIATSVTGSEVMKTALLRLQVCDTVLEESIRYYSDLIDTRQIGTKNIYRVYSNMLKTYGTTEKLPMESDLPMVDLEHYRKSNFSFLTLKNNWSSHPDIEDRISHVSNLNFSGSSVSSHEAVFQLRAAEKYETYFTNKIFYLSGRNKNVAFESIEDFETTYTTEKDTLQLSPVFNGYYKERDIVAIDWNQKVDTAIPFSELFSSTMVRTVFDVQSLSKDIEFITNIIKQNSGKSLGAIQFKGKRYKANNLVSLKYTLIKEKKALEATLDHNDANIFHYFLKEEAALGVSNPQLKSQVLKYTVFKEELKELKATEARVKEKCAFFAMELQTAMIHSHIKSLQHAEIDFKAAIEKIVKEDTFRVHIKTSELKFLERYVQNKLQYFALRNYIQADLEILFAAIAAFNSVLERPVLMQKKQVLDYMATLVSEKASAA